MTRELSAGRNGEIMSSVGSKARPRLGWWVLLATAFVPLAVAAQTKAPPGAAAPKAGAATAVMPGFETLPDGSTRVFVELSAPVTFETKPGAEGSTNYVLKTTNVARRNNTNPLVTEFFNTPVTSARLVPHGRDLWLVTETRAKVEPSVSVDTETDGGVTFSVRYPKGDYLPADAREADAVEFAPSGAAGAPAAGSAAPAAASSARPPIGRGGRGGGGAGRGGHRSHGASQ